MNERLYHELGITDLKTIQVPETVIFARNLASIMVDEERIPLNIISDGKTVTVLTGKLS